jgi:hypothetical protein
MSWFWGNGGNPFSSSLPLDHAFTTKVDDFYLEK